MTRFPPVNLHHPRPFDVVDDPIRLAGIGAAFEGVVGLARVFDAHGHQLAQAQITGAHGNGFVNFAANVAIGSIPAAGPRLKLVIAPEQEGGPPLPAVSLPVVLGRALVNPYEGFTVHLVKSGDTLSAIAQQAYGNAALYPRIFEANRDILTDPDHILVGQELRVPLA